jgi:Domain of unknown function (DUF1995)
LPAQFDTRLPQAINDGHKLVEVEFPPLAQEFLEDSTSSAYDISRANVRLASQFGEFFSIGGKRVAILLPDEPELEQAIRDEVSWSLIRAASR